MKSEKLDAVQVWKDFEDVLAPQLNFSGTDRVVYSHLLRHSRLEGKQRLRFSMAWLARGVGLSTGSVREAVRRLVARGVLGLVERNSQARHVVHVRLPQEVPAVRRTATSAAARPSQTRLGAASLEKMDFLRTQALRRAIHEREGGVCFYCLRQLIRRSRCLDHVVPRAQSGRNSYRNLVSCCPDCNSKKGERSAEDFVRELYRERGLSASDRKGRLHALDALAAGKLKPSLPGQGDRESDG
jgi:5-methylcytosine-specific restriction endonuclease McrA